MTERIRPPHVPIAEFVYRHEAEFAAGFLEDAGIPYLLQSDSDLGVMVSQPARLWVRSEDAEAALDAIEIPESGKVLEAERDDEPDPDSMAGELPARRAPSDSSDAAVVPGGPSGGPHGLSPGRLRPETRRRPAPSGTRLCGAERAVSATLSAILVSLGIGPLGGLGSSGAMAVWVTLCLVLGIAFGLSALTGRTLPPLKGVLAALSGVTP